MKPAIPATSVPLYIRCPGAHCSEKPMYWCHTACGTNVFVDENCDIYCTGNSFGCRNPKTRFIMNWFFKCNNVEQHKGEYFKFDEETLSFALSSVISMVKHMNDLSDKDRAALKAIYYKMQMKLMDNVKRLLMDGGEKLNAA